MDKKERYEKIQEENAYLLKDFEENLIKKNLNQKTIKRHINNVDFLINEYLAIDEEQTPDKLDKPILDCFFRWCINKWMFNTLSELCSVITSIKIFYKYLKEKKDVLDFEGIMEVCSNKDYYVEKFNIQEEKLYE